MISPSDLSRPAVIATPGAGVPPGVMLRIRFDPECDAFLTSLTTQIVGNVNVFQSHERYSASPFHIKLVELASNMLSPPNNAAYTALTCPQTFQRVAEVCARFNRIEGKIVPECIVNPASGEVCLHIKSGDCVNIGRHLSNALPGSNDWNCRLEENLLVSIGTFRGSHKSEFQDWLNNELSSNTDLFPGFSATSIEFSEEWLAGGFPQQAVMLTGLRPFASFAHFDGGHNQMHEMGGHVHVHGGHGGQELQHDGHHYAEDEDLDGQHDGGEATGAPRTVWGFVQGGGVPAALRDGKNGRDKSGKPIPKPAVAAYVKSVPGAKTINGQGALEVKGQQGDARVEPMVAWVCPMCKVENYPRRSVCFKCHTFKPDQLGMVHFHPRKPIITPTKPEGDVREGDWICASCNGHNFASKIACFTCRASRPAGSEGAGAPASGAEGAEGAEGGAEEGSKPAAAASAARPNSVKPGDWTCPKCKENVFAHRSRCYKCTTLKPSFVQSGLNKAN